MMATIAIPQIRLLQTHNTRGEILLSVNNDAGKNRIHSTVGSTLKKTSTGPEVG